MITIAMIRKYFLKSGLIFLDTVCVSLSSYALLSLLSPIGDEVELPLVITIF